MGTGAGRAAPNEHITQSKKRHCLKPLGGEPNFTERKEIHRDQQRERQTQRDRRRDRKTGDKPTEPEEDGRETIRGMESETGLGQTGRQKDREKKKPNRRY